MNRLSLLRGASMLITMDIPIEQINITDIERAILSSDDYQPATRDGLELAFFEDVMNTLSLRSPLEAMSLLKDLKQKLLKMKEQPDIDKRCKNHIEFLEVEIGDFYKRIECQYLPEMAYKLWFIFDQRYDFADREKLKKFLAKSTALPKQSSDKGTYQTSLFDQKDDFQERWNLYTSYIWNRAKAKNKIYGMIKNMVNGQKLSEVCISLTEILDREERTDNILNSCIKHCIIKVCEEIYSYKPYTKKGDSNQLSITPIKSSPK